jgi:hypothetical protein
MKRGPPEISESYDLPLVSQMRGRLLDPKRSFALPQLCVVPVPVEGFEAE